MAAKVNMVFSEVLKVPIESLGDHSSPENTPKWDSVATINLALALEDEFGVKFTTREIDSIRSIAAVKKVLQLKGVGDV